MSVSNAGSRAKGQGAGGPINIQGKPGAATVGELGIDDLRNETWNASLAEIRATREKLGDKMKAKKKKKKGKKKGGGLMRTGTSVGDGLTEYDFDGVTSY